MATLMDQIMGRADQRDSTPTLRPYDPTVYERLKYTLGGYGQERPSLARQKFVEGLLALVPGNRMQEAAQAAQSGRYGEAAKNVAASLPAIVPAARLPAAGAGALTTRAGTMPVPTSTALSPYLMVRNQEYLPLGMKTVGSSYATNTAREPFYTFVSRTNSPVGASSDSRIPLAAWIAGGAVGSGAGYGGAYAVDSMLRRSGSPAAGAGEASDVNPGDAGPVSLPAAAPEVPVDTMGTMYGFMPPAVAPAVPPATPASLADMYAGYRSPPATPASLADMYAGYRLPPMASPPMNITPPAPAAPAGGFVAPANVPLPPPRPADMSVRESFMQRLLGNPTQSNAMPVIISPQGPMPSGAAMPQQINWGDAENPADFFRASQALQAMPGLLGFSG